MSNGTSEVYKNFWTDSTDSLSQCKDVFLEYHSSPGNVDGTLLTDGTVLEENTHFLIKELAWLWMSDIKKTMRPASYACYQSNMDKYILPYIGNIPAASFNADILFSVLGQIKTGHGVKKSKEEPFSQHTLYLMENIIRAMFRYGAEKGLVPHISFGKSVYQANNKNEGMPLIEVEIQQLTSMSGNWGTDLQLQVLLPLYTGISLSELCALKWEDINLESGRIHIHRNIIRMSSEAGKERDREIQDARLITKKIKETGNVKMTAGKKEVNEVAEIKNLASKKKNGGIMATVLAECELPECECRQFTIPEKLDNLLKIIADGKKPLKEQYVAGLDKKQVSVKKPDTDLQPPDSRTLQYRIKSIGKELGIEKLNFQKLRDTFAVMCLQAGGDVYSVAYVLGISAAAVCDRYKPWLVRREEFLKGVG